MAGKTSIAPKPVQAKKFAPFNIDAPITTVSDAMNALAVLALVEASDVRLGQVAPLSSL
jgi:hypothetical protein